MPAQWQNMMGNPGRGGDGDAGPQFEIGAPDAPDFLNGAARTEWDRIVPELERAGLLTRVDHAALAMYCQAYARWRLAEQKIQRAAEVDPEDAGLIKASKNGFEQLNYWLVISNKAQEQLTRYLAEFGLSPSSRARVRAAAAQGDLFGTDALGGFLRAGDTISNLHERYQGGK